MKKLLFLLLISFSAYSQSAINIGAKAPLASPTFTGTPSLPTGTTGVTQTAGDNSTKVATTAYADNVFSSKTFSINANITNSSDPLTSALYTDVYMPFGATITGWLLYAQNGETGSASVEVRISSNSTRASFSSIVASAPVAMSSDTEEASTTLTGWTTAVPSGRWLRFYLSSVSSLTSLSIQLTYTR